MFHRRKAFTLIELPVVRKRACPEPRSGPVGSSRRGFTLIELLIVIAIIGILATIIIVSFTNAQAKARDNKRKADIQAISSAVEMFYVDNKVYPFAEDTGGGIYTVRSANNIGTGERWSLGFDHLLDGFISIPLVVDPKPSDNYKNHMTWKADLNPAEYTYTFLSSKYSYVLAARLEVETDGNGERFVGKGLKNAAGLNISKDILKNFTIDNNKLFFVGTNLAN